MPIPYTPPPRLNHLRNSLINCPTFVQLVGAANAEAAKGSIYFHEADDRVGKTAMEAAIATAIAGGATYEQAFRQAFVGLMQDPWPRAVLEDLGDQAVDRGGPDSYMGRGLVQVFIEFLEFSDAEMTAWYGDSPPFTRKDHTLHVKAVADALWRELAVTIYGNNLCLEARTCVLTYQNRVDGKEHNGLPLFAIDFNLEWVGLP